MTSRTIPVPSVSVYDYRGYCIIAMPSGIALVHAPANRFPSSIKITERPVVHQADSLIGAGIWVNTQLA
jgi:hypothetical protein